MEPILFLAHRIPFPPNKGDKIRSHHLLRHLAKRYRVHAGTFIDNVEDAVHIPALGELCASHCVVKLNQRTAALRSVVGLVTGEPLTQPYYRSGQLSRWVERTIHQTDIRKAVVFSSAMAQYVERLPNLQVVIDMVDVDSAKWTQYAERRAWPASLIYRREGERLLDVERRATARARATVFVTRSEADLFIRLAPECSAKVHVIEMGVDAHHLAPSEDRASPFAANEAAIVFTGAMDYWPNVDAVTWFAAEVLPGVLRQRPDARFYIVGMNPAKSVRALTSNGSVVVTAKVPDVRPYLQYAAAVVAPLRIARGIQNKILEAMAMARPVVVSAAAAGGLRGVPGVELEVAAGAAEFTTKLLAVMDAERGSPMGERARARILTDYQWPRNLAAFEKLIERESVSPEPTTSERLLHAS